MKPVIARGGFGPSLNRRARMADNIIYRPLLLSKLFGQKLEWTSVSCLCDSKSFNLFGGYDAKPKLDVVGVGWMWG